MRLTQARTLSQVFFLGLFLFLVFKADLRYMAGYPVSWFLELDPLVGLTTALATGELFHGLFWGLPVVVGTLLVGRFFCGWVCPFGALHHVVGWAARPRSRHVRAEQNRYRPMLYAVKYVVLIAMVVAAAMGSVQIGLLDPICLLTRSMTVAAGPVADTFVPGWFNVDFHYYVGGWLIGALVVFLLAMNVVIPRFFCRALCPLGALLGVLSRFSLWRVVRRRPTCNGCNLCRTTCEGACDPHADLRKSECFVCFNCFDDCKPGAMSFRFMPAGSDEIPGPQLPQRRAALGVMAGFLFFPMVRGSGASDENFSPAAIRPPGSTAEPEFLARCIKCEACARVCPTGVIQAAGFQTGVEGIWTPILNMKLGFCEQSCVLCGQVCPTGAIQPITIQQKMGLGEGQPDGPVKIGTAFIERGRCLPWAMERPCVVCEEVCPTSPKAVYSRSVEWTRRDGTKVTLQQPYVDPERCIGCGVCEHECPVRDKAAIRVTAIGETRSRERSLLLPGGAVL